MTLAFRMHKPTAKESGECVVRGIPGRKGNEVAPVMSKALENVKELSA
jgi:hypothetical protein